MLIMSLHYHKKSCFDTLMTIRFFVGLFLGLLLHAPAAFAASDFYLEVEGIPGESTDARLPGAIVLQSFNIGATTAPSSAAGGGGAGKVIFQDIHFTKFLDKASPLLYLNCASGKVIKRAILHCRKAGGGQDDYYTITLHEVFISGIQTGGGGAGGSQPTESFSLAYSKIEFSYAPQKADGSLDTPIKTGWDVKNNIEVRQ